MLSSTNRRAVRAGAALATAGLAVGAALLFPGPAGAAPQAHKVTICHATSSEKNPYVSITVDTSSINNLITGNGHGLHADDVIPPFVDKDGASYPGLNWPAGQDVYADGDCDGSGSPGGGDVG